MPIPLAVTHKNASGLLQTATTVEIATEGPFARLRNASLRQSCGLNDKAKVLVTSLTDGNSNGDKNEDSRLAIQVNSLNFSYPGIDGRVIPNIPPLLRNFSLALPQGSRCLLLGGNGVGKTTLLKILAGKTMVPRDSVKVLGRSPFYDSQLTVNGTISYIGGNWQREVAFAGYSVPLSGDFPASKMIDGIPNVDPMRKAALIQALSVNLNWRMHQVSEGQRRRVQLCVGLLRPCQVLFLDEVTVDLDILGRARLLAFLKNECEERAVSIVYATHIFDGLDDWPTHLAFVADGQLQVFEETDNLPELRTAGIMSYVVRLLTEQRERELKRRGPKPPVLWDPNVEGRPTDFSYAFNNGWIPGTMNSSLSTNALLRG